MTRAVIKFGVNIFKLKKHENIKFGRNGEGGGGVRWLSCLGFGIGLLGVAAAIASVPVTGPVGVGVAAQIIGGSIATGLSGGDCLF